LKLFLDHQAQVRFIFGDEESCGSRILAQAVSSPLCWPSRAGSEMVNVVPTPTDD
jgi:hypothetical protein